MHPVSRNLASVLLTCAFVSCTDSSGDGGGISFAPLADSDSDGLPDELELTLGSDPQNSSSPTPNGGGDTASLDGPVDGLSDALEAYLLSVGTNGPITHRSDQDEDGIPDYIEVAFGLGLLDGENPTVNGGEDTNDATGPSGDGVTDALEHFLATLGNAQVVDDLTDSDGDGFTDLVELLSGFDVQNGPAPSFAELFDVDGDGIPDYFEIASGTNPDDVGDPVVNGAGDDDGDGLSNAFEQLLEDMGAGPLVGPSTDSDEDGLPDYFEILAGHDAFDANSPVVAGGVDSDTDGISDAFEAALISAGANSPASSLSDTDGDSVPDFFEVVQGTDFLDSNSPVANGGNDADGDTISDALESVIESLGGSASADLETDTDGDGLPDYLEIFAIADLTNESSPSENGALDANDNGISDSVDAAALLLSGGSTSTVLVDIDGDGIPFYYEISSGTNPMDANSPLEQGSVASDEDGLTGPNGDGLSDALEALLISQGAAQPVTTASDSDADGLPDFLEVFSASNPFDANSPTEDGSADSDGDGISDAIEEFIADGGGGDVTESSDADEDGVSDLLEILNGTDPFDDESAPPIGSAPTASNVQISGIAAFGETLTGSYEFADSDGNSEGPTSLAWLRDGEPIESATSLDYTITQQDTGVTIGFRVTPASGTGLPPMGASVTASVFVPNEAPTAESVSIMNESGGVAIAGSILLAMYDFEDLEGDLEGASTFRWLVNGAPIPGATGSRYTLQGSDVSDIAGGSSITVEVSPVAETGTELGSVADSVLPTGLGLPPAVFGAASVQDVNGNQELDAGDTIIIPFDQQIQVVPGELELSELGELVVLRQDLEGPPPLPFNTDNLFENTMQLASFDADNPNPETSGKYSIMNRLEDFRGADGRFEFILTYYDVTVGGVSPIQARWYQTSNPLTHPVEDEVTGFELISNDVSDGSFGGIANTNLNGAQAYFNGNPNNANRWWWAIAAHTIWTGAGGNGVPASQFPPRSSGLNDLRVISYVTPPENAFALTSTGDSFGDGATFMAGPGPHEVTIILGSDPNLTTRGTHSSTTNAIGAATGIEFNRSGLIDAIQSLSNQVALDSSTIDLVPGFTERPDTLGTGDTYDLALVDIDGSGILHLVTANGSEQPGRVFLNDGDGNFTLSTQELGSANSRGIAAGDLNGDGAPDLVVANAGDQGNVVYLNNLDGTYSAFGAPLGNYDSQDVQLGFVNGDPYLDAVFMNASGQGNRVYLNDGAGNLSDSGQSLGESDSSAGVLVDINGDTHLDLVVANTNGGENALYLNSGTDGVLTLSPANLGAGNSTAVAVGDVDSNGSLDIVIANEDLGNVRYLDNGLGGFDPVFPFLGTGGSSDLTLVDLDGDGFLDLYVMNQGESSDEVFFNTGGGDFVPVRQELNAGNRRRFTVGDIDGDGDFDVILGTDEGNVILEGF